MNWELLGSIFSLFCSPLPATHPPNLPPSQLCLPSKFLLSLSVFSWWLQKINVSSHYKENAVVYLNFLEKERINGGEYFLLTYSSEQDWIWIVSVHTCLYICSSHLIGSVESHWIFDRVSGCAIFVCNESSEKRHCRNMWESGIGTGFGRKKPWVEKSHFISYWLHVLVPGF